MTRTVNATMKQKHEDSGEKKWNSYCHEKKSKFTKTNGYYTQFLKMNVSCVRGK
jgi:hypothetical protein